MASAAAIQPQHLVARHSEPRASLHAALSDVGLSIEVAGLWATNKRKSVLRAPKLSNLPPINPPEGMATDLIGRGMPLVETSRASN